MNEMTIRGAEKMANLQVWSQQEESGFAEVRVQHPPGGTQTSAVLFSLIETTKENGLDPYKYLTWALEEASQKPAAGLVPWKFR